MLAKFTFLLLMQISLNVVLVLGQVDLEPDIEEVGNDDGVPTLLKATIDSTERVPVKHYKPSNHGGETKPQWVFKQMRAKKEVRGFILTNEEIEKFKIWKDGIIPYYIDTVSFGDKVLRDKIRRHLQMVNSGTGVNFVELMKPPEDEKERWVFFLNRRGLLGCGDHNVKNFTNTGAQRVVLGYDCMYSKGELGEAVMSILGIPAEHNSPDRDEYIKIRMDNILPDKRYLFEKLTDRDWLFHDLHYDFHSITHYDLHKYSANGYATIIPMHHSDDFKPATKYSPSDIRKIKMLYSYISKQKKMQVSACAKLFDANTAVKPEKKRINYLQKPSRYLGIAKDNSTDSSSSTSDDSDASSHHHHHHNDKQKPQDGDNEQILPNDKIISKEKENINDESDKSDALNGDETGIRDSVANKNKSRLIFKNKTSTSLLTLSDYQTSEENRQLLLKAPISKHNEIAHSVVHSLLQLPDYDSSEDYKKVPLKGVMASDPMIWSDYQTDEGK